MALALFVATAGGCRGDDTAPRAAARDTVTRTAVQVTVVDTILTLARGTSRTTISLGEHVNGSGEYSSSILDQRRGGDGRLYLLVRTVGGSRPHDPHGRCGAGEETNIIWLAVDPAMRVAGTKSVLVESCILAHQPVSKSAELTGEPWSISFYIPGDSITTASYDRRNPERGLRVATVPDTTTR
jgi:hypothetical protein